jgi:hypothetical protein
MRVTPDVLGEVNIEHRLTDRIGLITPRTPPADPYRQVAH